MPAVARTTSGFTLLELIVNIAIIAILAAIAIPAFMSFREKAKIAQAKADIRKIRTAIEQLLLDTGQWPGHQNEGKTNTSGTNEIWDLSAANAGLLKTDGLFPNWRGPYLQSVPKDPWGMNYFFDTDYSVSGQWKVALGSFGPNKCCQNTYDSDDIVIFLTD